MPPPPTPSLPWRVLATWLVIFPLVAAGQLVMAPLTESWNPIARTAVLTAVVVPFAVCLAVPRLLGALHAVRRRYGRTA